MGCLCFHVLHNFGFAGIVFDTNASMSDGVSVRLDNDLTFAYDHIWRGATITGHRPSVQGAFTVALPYRVGDWLFDTSFNMMIANMRKGHASGYEEKVFHLGLTYEPWTLACERVLYFTLGDSIIYPTRVEKNIALSYMFAPVESFLVHPKLTAFWGQNSGRSVEWMYHVRMFWHILDVNVDWGFYEPHGRYVHASYALHLPPYDFGIRYGGLQASPESFFDDGSRWYFFVRYRTTLYPHWQRTSSVPQRINLQHVL